LRLASDKVRGQVGGQNVDLVMRGDRVDGVRLRVPATLVSRRDVELATLFTALLSR
jgi:hypothetical protein